jgi:hypothetical protein
MWSVDDHEFRRGIALFNRREFYDAHEVLEDVWRAAPAEEKLFLQGLIQVAVALHHHSQDNLPGAQSLLARAERNLSGYPEGYAGVQLSPLREAITAWRSALADGDAEPAPPRIDLRNSGTASEGADHAT